MIRVGVVVAAAGAGSRLGRGSKGLLRVAGRTLVARALDLFLPLEEVVEVIVVAPPADLLTMRVEVDRAAPDKPVRVVAGGDHRQHSVAFGLRALGDCELVLVHDVARPLASPELVRRVIVAAGEFGAAIPGLPSSDTLKQVRNGGVVESLDRSQMVRAQTPQGFARSVLEEAHRWAQREAVLADDDAQIVHRCGHSVALVEGEESNLKLTTPGDLNLIEALLAVAPR
ncbi:MAG TPA: 2-C-methyl-D-erythritol 4-phosphate cytidylyltransferase [Candidatus Acidoferrales bacterium]|nr:2-C-methyl-D-erythritol 4-phosphate cytidylyltransferase [Candidatus Acidoferrales bacterium]